MEWRSGQYQTPYQKKKVLYRSDGSTILHKFGAGLIVEINILVGLWDQ